jgi:hypothetical protein
MGKDRCITNFQFVLQGRVQCARICEPNGYLVVEEEHGRAGRKGAEHSIEA